MTIKKKRKRSVDINSWKISFFFLTHLLKWKKNEPTRKICFLLWRKCDEENLKKGTTGVNDFFMFSSKLELILFLSGNIQRHYHKKKIFFNANALISAYEVIFLFWEHAAAFVSEAVHFRTNLLNLTSDFTVDTKTLRRYLQNSNRKGRRTAFNPCLNFFIFVLGIKKKKIITLFLYI